MELHRENGASSMATMAIHPAQSGRERWLDGKEKQFLAQKLEDCGGNINLTARSCGIGRRSLHRKMQKYGLDKKCYKRRSTERADSNTNPAAETIM